MSMDGTSIKIIDSPVSTSMRRNPPTVSPSEPISSLSYIMIRENIGAVIVIEKGKPIGIITEKDILERVLTQDKDIYKTHAKDIMSTPLISIEANQPIRDALKLMNDKKIRRLAVMEEGSLIGLITERRLLESICNLIV
jgi:CBS domain-containing protein